MDFTFEINNQNELTSFFSVIKTIDFEQLRGAIEKVEQDMILLSKTNKRILEMKNDDIMWDAENRRIKIKINKSEQWKDSDETYCANLGAFNGLVRINCGLEIYYIEYEEFNDMRAKYIEEEILGKHPSVITLIDGLVETLRKRYGVKLENFEEIEKLQEIDSKRRKMYASLMVRSNAEKQSTGVTHSASTVQQSDIGPR